MADTQFTCTDSCSVRGCSALAAYAVFTEGRDSDGYFIAEDEECPTLCHRHAFSNEHLVRNVGPWLTYPFTQIDAKKPGRTVYEDLKTGWRVDYFELADAYVESELPGFFAAPPAASEQEGGR